MNCLVLHHTKTNMNGMTMIMISMMTMTTIMTMTMIGMRKITSSSPSSPTKQKYRHGEHHAFFYGLPTTLKHLHYGHLEKPTDTAYLKTR